MNLQILRARIDRIDRQLVRLLNARARTAQRIGRLKHSAGRDTFVPAREREVLDQVGRLSRGPLPAAAVREVFREIISASRACEKRLRVACGGAPLSGAHEAAARCFGHSADCVTALLVTEAFAAVRRGTADYAVVPLDNTDEGTEAVTWDCLARGRAVVCAEVWIELSESLWSRAPLCRVGRVYGHPRALGRCREWVQRRLAGAEIIPALSEISAVERAAADPGSAALGRAVSGRMYGLTRRARAIGGGPVPQARYAVIGLACGEPSGDDKTLLLVRHDERGDGLWGVLDIIRRRRLNVMSVQSLGNRRAGRRWFRIEIQGHERDRRLAAALHTASRFWPVRAVGSFPAAPELDRRGME